MFLVVEPMVVKTVSNKIESWEKLSLADGSVSNLSFLQDIKLTDKQIVINIRAIFRVIKQIYNFNNDKEEIILYFWENYLWFKEYYYLCVPNFFEINN